MGYAPPLFMRYTAGVMLLALASWDTKFACRLIGLAAPIGIGVAMGHWIDHMRELAARRRLQEG